MIERLEVSAGSGTVIRFGDVAAWASPAASPGLISFLAESARNLSASPGAGQHLAEHLAGVLRDRDPEPQVAFAVVGPSSDGWVGLLHGPVQVWDGARWVGPSPQPGWLRCTLWPRPSVAVTPAGATVPAVSPDSLLDLESGVVPGGGYVLVPAAGSAYLGRTETATALSVVGTGETGFPGDDTAVQQAVDLDLDLDPPEGTAPYQPEPSHRDAARSPGFVDPGQPKALPGSDGEGGSSGPVTPGPPGSLDLRDAGVLSRAVAYPPLAIGAGQGPAGPGSPVVQGAPCRRGHLNRPGMLTCPRCGSDMASVEPSYTVNGTRPALGCLIIDDGWVHGLDFGYVVGSDPGHDPNVRGGLARPLALTGSEVAAIHAEIGLQGWEVTVTDRASRGGTYVYQPGASEWERLRPHQPRPLQPGAHIAFAQRVATFVTPWIASGRPAPARGPVEGAGDNLGSG